MNGKHFNNSNKKSHGKIAAIIISVVVVAALAVAAVILFIPSFGNSSKNTPTATHPSITERTQETTQTDVTEHTSVANTESVTGREQGTTSDDIQESTEEGVPMQSSNHESVVVPGNPENASYFSADFSPYKAVDSSTDEECSLKEVFGSSYSGGSVVFNSDGTFTDSLTNSSANSGAYAVEDSKLLATYSNDKNMDVSVTSWNGDAPSEIVINYGGYYVYLN